MKLNRINISLKLAVMAAVVLTSAAFASCDKNAGLEEVVDSAFVIGGNKIQKADKDGGEDYWMSYSISGPREGQVATVESGCDWIVVKDVYSTEFRYSVVKNDTGSDRRGEILLSAVGVKPARITLIQSASNSASVVFKNFEIKVSGITTSTCRIQVKPVDAGKTYLYAVARKAEYEKETAKSYIEARIDQIKDKAAKDVQSPSAYLSKGVVDTDNLSEEYRPSLYDRTTYCLTAFDLSYDEKKNEFSYSGDIDVVEFTSASATPSAMDITILQNGSLLTFRPSNVGNGDSYICDYMTKESWDELDSPDYAAHQYVLYAQKLGYFESFTTTNVVDLSKDVDMVKGEKYVAYAVGYRDSATDGGLTTEVKFIEFTY